MCKPIVELPQLSHLTLHRHLSGCTAVLRTIHVPAMMWLGLKSSGGDCVDFTAVFPVVEDCNRNSSNLSSLHSSKVSFFHVCLRMSSRRLTSRIPEFESNIDRDSSPSNISLSFEPIRNLDQSHIQMLIRSMGILDLSTIDISYMDGFPVNQVNVLEIYRPARDVKCMSIAEFDAEGSSIEDDGVRSPLPNLQALRCKVLTSLNTSILDRCSCDCSGGGRSFNVQYRVSPSNTIDSLRTMFRN